MGLDMENENKGVDYRLDYIEPIKRKDFAEDDETKGSTHNKKSACGNLYITINRDDQDNIVESFINTGRTGICKASIDAINIMISDQLRAGIKVSAITRSLKGIQCGACMKAPKDSVSGLSCADIIARVIEKEYKKNPGTGRGKSTDETNPMSVTNEDGIYKCKECGKTSYVPSGGCGVCIECGYTKCDL
jgi:ribonucleoside-diphosphate reductase alpha chain